MPELKKGSRTEFPAGTKVARGEFPIPLASNKRDIATAINSIGNSLAFKDAVSNFVKEFGRYPRWDMILFRGTHTTLNIVVEIGELPQ